jgi:hypothetical protein
MAERPTTFDPWEFVRYCLTYGDGLYVRVQRQDEDTGKMVWVNLPLSELTPDEWVHWVRQWYFVQTAPVKTLEEWEPDPAPYPPAPEFE